MKDPAGNVWWIATHVEDVPDEELARRAKAAAQARKPAAKKKPAKKKLRR